jgi:hypothetical protein
MTELKCQRCGTLLIAKDGIYTCPKCINNPPALAVWLAIISVLLMIAALSVDASAQITPSWQQSPVLKGPKSPSPADLFRHHCRQGFAWNVRYHRCMPTRRHGPWRNQ